MNRRDKIFLRQSEIRTELSGLLDTEVEKRGEDFGEKVNKLTKDLQGLETELRAAIAVDGAETEPEKREDLDAETREKRELLGKCSLGNYLKAAASGQILDGAEAECSAAFGCPGQLPIEIFESLRETRSEDGQDRETRDVTSAPATTNRTLHGIAPALFDASVLPFLGLSMPRVNAGVQSYPVLSTSLTAGVKKKDAAADEGTGALTVSSVSPKRITGQLRLRVEDLAVLPAMEQAFRQNLSMVLSDKLDDRILNGAGGVSDVNGLFNQLTDAEAPANNAETFQRYVAAFSSHLDGLHATGPRGIRALIGPATGKHMLGTFATNDDAVSAYSYLAREFGGVRVSKRIPDPASNVQSAVMVRPNPANDMVGVVATWQGISFIRDQITDAAKGHIIITALALVSDVVLLRGGCFVEDSFRLAA